MESTSRDESNEPTKKKWFFGHCTIFRESRRWAHGNILNKAWFARYTHNSLSIWCCTFFFNLLSTAKICLLTLELNIEFGCRKMLINAKSCLIDHEQNFNFCQKCAEQNKYLVHSVFFLYLSCKQNLDQSHNLD